MIISDYLGPAYLSLSRNNYPFNSSTATSDSKLFEFTVEGYPCGCVYILQQLSWALWGNSRGQFISLTDFWAFTTSITSIMNQNTFVKEIHCHSFYCYSTMIYHICYFCNDNKCTTISHNLIQTICAFNSVLITGFNWSLIDCRNPVGVSLHLVISQMSFREIVS